MRPLSALRVCALPFPSSFFQTESAETTTGYRLNFGPESLPASSITNRHISPDLFRYVDGFGLGSQMYTLIPYLDSTNLPDEKNIAESITDNSSLILLEVGDDNTRRVPCWAELDAGETDPAIRALLINPAEILQPDHQYIVVLRNLSDIDGAPIIPSPATQALLDGTTRGTAMADGRFTLTKFLNR